MTNPKPGATSSLDGCRILILTGDYAGEEGICLGGMAGSGRWAVSPDGSTAILALDFGREFALLLDLSVAPARN
ncbi:MAG TPA: hypothetical protein VG936_12510 [Lacunisphaera sp.]|nr:hypothetical protein [Lacunisphaera sp.]